ncbi:MAG: hypothetical protein IPI22_00965 [Bacteroidetes bacterium]|nr:hypothetical protein [Bacteroidota bacterium]
MKKYFLIVSFLFFGFWLQAIDYSGIYNYNKGVNKANGTICLFQINMDSAFFYLNNMSGAPDFNLTTIKGFLRIDTNACFYKRFLQNTVCLCEQYVDSNPKQCMQI